MPTQQSDRPPTNPVTAAEHEACYRHHKGRAEALCLKLEKQTATMLVATTALDEAASRGRAHRETIAEYTDELVCAAGHYATVQMLKATGLDEGGEVSGG